MPLCTCGHEDREHEFDSGADGTCLRPTCDCDLYNPRPARTVSFTDLPVSQGARDLWEKVVPPDDLRQRVVYYAIDILAAADPKDVTNLLWARRAGKL